MECVTAQTKKQMCVGTHTHTHTHTQSTSVCLPTYHRQMEVRGGLSDLHSQLAEVKREKEKQDIQLRER